MRAVLLNPSRCFRLLALVGLLVAVGASAAWASSPVVKTGIYSAVTSQGSAFTFKVVTHCVKNPATRCLYSDTYPSVPAPCPNGQTGGGVLNYPQGAISKSGKLSVTEGTIGAGTYVKITLKITGNSVTGTLRALFPEQAGQAVPACDTGTVSFSGHRGS
jgi:hypothetical protein